MGDLSEFIEARLAETEELANATRGGKWRVFDMDEAHHGKGEPMNPPGMGWYWVWQDNDSPYFNAVMQMERQHPDVAPVGSSQADDGDGGLREQADAHHIAHHDPEAVLAWVKAIRVAVATCGQSECSGFRDQDEFGGKHHPDPGWSFCDGCSAAESADHQSRATLRALATAWATHPDYPQD